MSNREQSCFCTGAHTTMLCWILAAHLLFCACIEPPPQLFEDQWIGEIDDEDKTKCKCLFLNNLCFFYLRMGMEFPYHRPDQVGKYLRSWPWWLIEGCDGDEKEHYEIPAFPIAVLRWIICIFRAFTFGTQDHLWSLAYRAFQERRLMNRCIANSPWRHAKLLVDPLIWTSLANTTKDIGWRKYFKRWQRAFQPVAMQGEVVPLPESYRRCTPINEGCWLPESSTYMSSCLSCCSPYEGPKGLFGCFTKDFGFEKCCNTGSAVQALVNANDAKAVATLVPRATVLEEISLETLNWKTRPAKWQDVVEELSDSCVGEDAASASASIHDKAHEIDDWIRSGHEMQRIFHSADMYVTLRACTLLDKWSVVGDSGEDGASLWFKSGVLCDDRIEWNAGDCCPSLGTVTVERRSKINQYLQIPCEGVAPERHYAFHFSMHLMLNVKSLPAPSPSLTDCPARDVDSIAILVGHPGFINHGHALHDFAFLGNVLRLASLGAFKSLSQRFHIVPTRWYIQTWVQEKWQVEWRVPTSPFRENLMPIAQLFFDAALKFGEHLNVSIFKVEYDNLNCWRCHLSTVQQWRFMVGDGEFWNSYRAHMLSFCDIVGAPELPFRKKVVLVQRTRFVRGLANIAEVAAALLQVVPAGWSVEVVLPGDLYEPCDQLKAFYDASLMVSVSGSEPYMAAVMPERSALISIDANTMEEENLTDLSDKMPEPVWTRLLEETTKNCHGPVYTSNGRTQLSGRDGIAGLANARNMWFTSLTNATCLRFEGSDCKTPWTMGLVHADVEFLGRVVDAAIRTHLSKFLPS